MNYLHKTLLILFAIGLSSTVSAQIKDTVNLGEVVVERGHNEKITGLLSGNIALDAEGVKKLPSLLGNTNLLKLLELTPGIQASGDGNSNLYVRGGDPGQNLLLYNSSPVYTPGHLLSLFPLFNANHMQSLQLYKSGVSAAYGGYLSSVIDARAKSEVPQHWSLIGNVGILSSQATLYVPVGKNFGAYVSGRATYLNLILEPLLNATTNKRNQKAANNLDYNFNDYNITIVGALSPKNQLQIHALSSNDKLGIHEDEIALHGLINWKNTVLSTELHSQLNPHTQLEQSFIYSQFSNSTLTNQADIAVHLNSSIQDIGYKNKLNYTLAHVEMCSGMQYIHHRILPQDISIENTDLVQNKPYTGKSQANDVSAYTQATFRPNPNWYISSGMRYTYYNTQADAGRTKNFNSLDLRLACRYRLSENKFLRASGSSNTQYINKLTPSSTGLPTDFWISSDYNVPPQKGTEVDLGYYQSLKEGVFEFSSDLYYRHMKQVTEFDINTSNEGTDRFTDRIRYGTGQSMGWEMIFKKNTGSFTGWISYTLSHTTRQFAQLNNGNPFPALYDRTHNISLVASYTFNEHWDASMVYVYATGNTYTQPSSWYFINNMPVKDYNKYHGARMPNYNRTDLSVNYWFRKNNGLNFSIYNLFMVNNPLYIFMALKRSDENNENYLEIKQTRLYTIIPSISWKFQF